MNDQERWLPIVGYEGLYEISTWGRVKSLPRIDASGHKRRGLILKPVPDSLGYLYVTLCTNGVKERRSVHGLVLEAFDRPKPEGMQCRHLDGDPGNNHWPENICWGTPAEDGEDKIRLGRWKGSTSQRAEDRARLAKIQAMDPDERAALMAARLPGYRPGGSRSLESNLGSSWGSVLVPETTQSSPNGNPCFEASPQVRRHVAMIICSNKRTTYNDPGSLHQTLHPLLTREFVWSGY